MAIHKHKEAPKLHRPVQNMIYFKKENAKHEIKSRRKRYERERDGEKMKI